MTWPALAVSVIIPCHNHAPFLARRIASIRDQTRGDFEVLFIDDGSTDASFDTARALAGDDPRFAFARTAAPTGNPFAVWRLGLTQARAPFVWIAESDDACEPDFLAELAAILLSGPDIGLAYCQSLEIDATDRAMGTLAAHTDAIDPFRWQADALSDGRQECRQALLFRNTIPNASACLFRAEALRHALAATEGFCLCGDWACYVALALAGWRIAYRARMLNHYRRHAGTQRQALARRGVEIAEAVEVKRRIKAALPLTPGEIAAASALTLERLTDLAKECGAMTASGWFADGSLLAALTDFDPHFLAALAGMAPNRRLWLDIYAEDDGHFHEGRKCTLPYGPNAPHTLGALVPAGRLRIDPSHTPGLYRIRAIRVFTADTDQPLAAFAVPGLGGLTLEGPCLALSCDAAGVLLYAYGDDPICILPPLGEPGARLRVAIEIAGYSLVPGDTPFPAHP